MDNENAEHEPILKLVTSVLHGPAWGLSKGWCIMSIQDLPKSVRVDCTRLHTLKTWPEFFPTLADGRKTFELRRADRDFRPGHVLELVPYDPTEAERRAFVGNLAEDARVGLQENGA